MQRIKTLLNLDPFPVSFLILPEKSRCNARSLHQSKTPTKKVFFVKVYLIDDHFWKKSSQNFKATWSKIQKNPAVRNRSSSVEWREIDCQKSPLIGVA